ncbi:hypothetical protein CCMSSC00406_0000439 [Pleurotus cornucopiae]|uniref:Uncharacterized protein n=1 Tax=Pleurotus cornucopiae TaxID=5321 RepID=A0ACB7IXB7_PLECO|nr:hypothetical protein CCMSSC00406_0000439 [Pleurotus cornucopiae]
MRGQVSTWPKFDKRTEVALCLSFKPLFELRMALREWETFFLGTARRNGGNRSSKNDRREPAPSTVASSAVRPNFTGAWKEGMLKKASRVAFDANADMIVDFRKEGHAVSRHKILKRTTGIAGLSVHPDPLPQLAKTYESTLSALAAIPPTSVYRQGVEALTQRKLKIVQDAQGDIAAVEKQLDEGQIEESLDIASDELKLAAQMADWKAWEPLEEKPPQGQWEYFGQESTAST